MKYTKVKKNNSKIETMTSIRKRQTTSTSTFAIYSFVFIYLSFAGLGDASNFTEVRKSLRSTDPFLAHMPNGANYYNSSSTTYALWTNVSPNGYNYIVMPSYVGGFSLVDKFVPHHPDLDGNVFFYVYFTTQTEEYTNQLRDILEEYCEAMKLQINPLSGKPFDLIVTGNYGIMGAEYGVIGGQYAVDYRLAIYFDHSTFAKHRPEPVGYFNYIQPKDSDLRAGGQIANYGIGDKFFETYQQIKSVLIASSIEWLN